MPGTLPFQDGTIVQVERVITADKNLEIVPPEQIVVKSCEYSGDDIIVRVVDPAEIIGGGTKDIFFRRDTASTSNLYRICPTGVRFGSGNPEFRLTQVAPPESVVADESSRQNVGTDHEMQDGQQI